MAIKERLNQWDVATCDEGQAGALAAALQLPLPLARTLASRGCDTMEAAKAFLDPQLDALTDPFLMPGMAAAARRTVTALQDGQKITIYSDYDCDGLTTTAVLLDVLRDCGGQVDFFIPRRAEDGYGFTLGTLDKVLAGNQPQLIITADCGMRSGDAVAEARAAGVDVIIIDHHRSYGEALPEALALLSPVLDGVPAAMTCLASSGMAFMFCRALRAAAIEAGLAAAKELDLWKYLDLVTIGTISDLMHLVGDNRILVAHGLALLNDVAKRRPGVLALIRAAGIRTEIGSYEVGFQMGPRLNAAGRVGNPELALQLLVEIDAMQARRLAGQVDACNRERKRIEDGVHDAAMESVADAVRADCCGLVAVGRKWHIGTIGVVAARLCGRFHRPVAVITIDEHGSGRGSCRSTAGVNLETVLERCVSWLEQFGGHATAAGFSIRQENVKAFREAFEGACRECMVKEDLTEQYVIDSWVTLGEADASLFEAQRHLQPYGLGNPTPVWGARNVRVQGPAKIVGGNHLKITLVNGATQCDAIGYGMGDRKLPEGALDVLFQLQYNHYQGRKMLQMSIKDFRPSGA